jgi:glycosyltransferase involved in cell wall biosynthesis
MKILQIFNRYAHMGGEEIAVGRISGELSEHHEFREILFDSNEWTARTGILDRARQFLQMVWNPGSIARVREQLDEFHPDVILLHNLMPIGSAGLYLFLKRRRVPIVHFIHNFRPFSVSGYCWGGNKLLPQGLKKNFIPEILAGAWQESRVKTAWYGLLIWLLHQLGAYRRIDGWIAISKFMKSAFVEGGIEPDRIRVISHSWTPQCTDAELAAIEGGPPEPMFLFLGRLTEEKGLRVLLDAWQLVEKSSATGRLVIAGDGPLADEVARRCGEMKRATCVGFTTGEDKKRLLRDTTALVVPSIWWEPLGLVLYEAYDYGKPVLAARSGGIVDHVADGKTGWLHEPGDFQTLASHMLRAIADTAACRTMGTNGRRLLLERSAGVWIHDFDDFVGGIVRNSKTPAAAGASPVRVQVYLADQNPGHDRSFGISRMSHVVLDRLATSGGVEIRAITSKTSQKAPDTVKSVKVLPWGTRSRATRLLSDHLHPLLCRSGSPPDVHYFPKGYLPLLSRLCRPSVVTIHDTIIQYDEDRYPEWRKPKEYAYWAHMLKHTLRRADRIMTVSESSKGQITAFMDRHGIPRKEITVTYEPCHYERIPQPSDPEKDNFVIHLASCEPHKRTAHLIRWWHEAESRGRTLPMLHLIGTVPPEVEPMLASSHSIVKRPFLEDAALQAAYRSARALVLPSEIEGFGLPALEAYYLGTPVCFVRGTSVEEILGVVTDKGGFSLDDPESLFAALEEVMRMSAEEIRGCGLKLRETYAEQKVAEKMLAVFRAVKH